MSQGDDPKPRTCEGCGWLLGMMVKENRHTTLWVFEKTVERVPAVFTDDIYRVVSMESGNIKCGHCGRIHVWHFSQRRLEELLTHRIHRTFGLEGERG